MKLTTIHLASDHAGYLLKRHVISFLQKEGYSIVDHGADSEQSVDYPDYAHKLAKNINEQTFGIAVCGSGIGISIALNRHSNVRQHCVGIKQWQLFHANTITLMFVYFQDDFYHLQTLKNCNSFSNIEF